MIGNCPDYCNPQFHYDPHLQTKWKFEISTIIIIIIIIITLNEAFQTNKLYNTEVSLL